MRDILTRNGSLTALLTHPQWENIGRDGEHDRLGKLMRDFYRVHPWMIALTCAMLYPDNYVLEHFIQSDSAIKYDVLLIGIIIM